MDIPVVPVVPRTLFRPVSATDLLYLGAPGPAFTVLRGGIVVYLVDGSLIDIDDPRQIGPALLDPLSAVAASAASLLKPRNVPIEDRRRAEPWGEVNFTRADLDSSEMSKEWELQPSGFYMPVPRLMREPLTLEISRIATRNLALAAPPRHLTRGASRDTRRNVS